MLGVHFGRVMHSQPVVRVFGESRIRPGFSVCPVSEVEHRDGHKTAADKQEDLRIEHREVASARSQSFTGRLKELLGVTKFDEFQEGRIAKSYRRRLGWTVVVTARIPKGTSCPVDEL